MKIKKTKGIENKIKIPSFVFGWKENGGTRIKKLFSLGLGTRRKRKGIFE